MPNGRHIGRRGASLALALALAAAGMLRRGGSS